MPHTSSRSSNPGSVPPASSTLRSFSPVSHLCTGVAHPTICTHPLNLRHSGPPSDSAFMFFQTPHPPTVPPHEATASWYSASFWTSTASQLHGNLEGVGVCVSGALCMGLCVLSCPDLCGQLRDVCGWLRSAPSFWKHLTHMCLTLTSLSCMFFCISVQLMDRMSQTESPCTTTQ